MAHFFRVQFYSFRCEFCHAVKVNFRQIRCHSFESSWTYFAHKLVRIYEQFYLYFNVLLTSLVRDFLPLDIAGGMDAVGDKFWVYSTSLVHYPHIIYIYIHYIYMHMYITKISENLCKKFS